MAFAVITLTLVLHLTSQVSPRSFAPRPALRPPACWIFQVKMSVWSDFSSSPRNQRKTGLLTREKRRHHRVWWACARSLLNRSLLSCRWATRPWSDQLCTGSPAQTPVSASSPRTPSYSVTANSSKKRKHCKCCGSLLEATGSSCGRAWLCSTSALHAVSLYPVSSQRWNLCVLSLATGPLDIRGLCRGRTLGRISSRPRPRPSFWWSSWHRSCSLPS